MNYADKKKKRVERFVQLKNMLMDEYVKDKEEQMAGPEGGKDEEDGDNAKDIETFVEQWSKDFDKLNANPEENSDFDSDNDINPLDTLTSSGKYTSSVKKPQQISSDNRMKKKPIQLAIVGRPNVGKSTLVNGLLKESRVIANDLPGTTRDSVQISWTYGGRRVLLVDTAGIKPGTSVKTQVEQIVSEQVKKSIDFAHVAIVLIDSVQAFTTQDMMVIRKVLEEGRAVVIAANKWDLVEDKYKKKAVKWMEKQVEKGLGQVKGVPMAFVSAKTGLRVDRIMDEVMRVYEKWNTRVSTGLLNKWIHAFSKVQKMPSDQGKTLKMRYMMQIKTRPPTFFLYVNNKRLVNEDFERFIRNSIAKEFGFEGVPVRVLVRDNKMQYARKGYSNLSASARLVLERIKMHKKMKKSITYRRRVAGNRFLYRK